MNPINGTIFNFFQLHISAFYSNLKSERKRFCLRRGVESRTEDDIMYYSKRCITACLRITGIPQIHQFCFQPFCPEFFQLPNTSPGILKCTYSRSLACNVSQLFLSSTSLSESSRKQENKCSFLHALLNHIPMRIFCCLYQQHEQDWDKVIERIRKQRLFFYASLKVPEI